MRKRVAQAAQSGDSRIQTGGNLVAPALDLVEVARRLGKLDEVRRRVEQAPQTDDWSRRARLAMLAIIDMAREQPKAANRIARQAVGAAGSRRSYGLRPALARNAGHARGALQSGDAQRRTRSGLPSAAASSTQRTERQRRQRGLASAHGRRWPASPNALNLKKSTTC